MTAVTTRTGALSDRPTAWHAINWYAVHRQVRRLQARMVKAVQAKRWGKVHALQHLLTHSFSGKALAVKRVATNDGRKTLVPHHGKFDGWSMSHVKHDYACKSETHNAVLLIFSVTRY
jgi:hypothetical protein